MTILERRVSIHYPVGTQCAEVRRERPDSPEINYDEIELAIRQAVMKYQRQYGKLDAEDMFITIGFSTLNMVVEVSDRLVH